MMSLLILSLTTCLLHVEAAPDVAAWDLWPLVTPVLGSISAECYEVELETKVHAKVCNHGEGSFYGLVESGYYHFHI